MMHVPNNAAAARFAFDNTYARELEGFCWGSGVIFDSAEKACFGKNENIFRPQIL
jgi:hypothetical protein